MVFKRKSDRINFFFPTGVPANVAHDVRYAKILGLLLLLLVVAFYIVTWTRTSPLTFATPSIVHSGRGAWFLDAEFLLAKVNPWVAFLKDQD